MQGTQAFKATIKAYLDKRAESDTLFAKSYQKQGKTLDKCINYILSEVQKSKCNGFADEEIYSLAVHYYDEDNIKIGELNPHLQVVVNHHVELTEEEKKEQRQKALDEYKQECLRQEREKHEKQQSIVKAKQEKAKAKDKAQGQLSLFDF